MKKIITYFDPNVKRIFVEKVLDNGEKKLVLSSPYNFAYTSEIVARVIDVENADDIPSKIDQGYEYYNVLDYRPIKADSGIYYDETINAYKAADFGFIVLEGDRLRWLSPLSATRDKFRAYYTIHPTKNGRLPSYGDIQEAMHEFKILSGLGQAKIEEQLVKYSQEKPGVARILVAQGREPVNGHEEYFLPLLDITKKAGEILSDGRIDFKETGSIIQIIKNQEILEKVAEVKLVDGYDIYGNKMPAQLVEHDGFRLGQNIVQSGHNPSIYISAIDGCLSIEKRIISVLPVVVINGDVNYDTGNIDFNGSVQINGSVLPGFSVRAKGDIIIEKNVDDSYIHADGDITVKMGIAGKGSSKVISGGKVTARYLLNANVEANDEITIEDSIINSNVFSNNKITVVAKHGKIIGGKATALYEIIVNVSGAINETETSLNVGRNLFIEKELEVLQKDISNWRAVIAEIMRKLKVNFGEAVFENPKEYISRLPSMKKKSCLLLLKELSNSNKELKLLVEKSKEVQNKLRLEKEPVIIIKNKAYPGTLINIKKSIKKIDSVIDNVKYYEDSNEKIIRFTPAV